MPTRSLLPRRSIGARARICRGARQKPIASKVLRRRSSFIRPSPCRSAACGSGPVRSDPHQLLAEIGALQKPHERSRSAVESFGNEFLVFDLALAHPLRHVAQEIPMTRGEIADDESPDIQPL